MRILALVVCAGLGVLNTGCVFRYANAERNIDSAFRRVYVPAVTDASTRGGQAGRVSSAVRRALSLDTRFALVPANEARVAVDVQILESAKVTTEVVECKAGTEVLAAESSPCEVVQKGFILPDASAERETALLDVRIRLVDLNTGRLLHNRVLPQVSSGAYPLVGEAEARAGLRRTPELHALRYVEKVDSAIDRIGQTVAAEVVGVLLSLDASSQGL